MRNQIGKRNLIDQLRTICVREIIYIISFFVNFDIQMTPYKTFTRFVPTTFKSAINTRISTENDDDL